MKLVIGGYAQGKLAYVLHKTGLPKEAVWTAQLPCADEIAKGKELSQESSNVQLASNGKEGMTLILYRFHEWVRTQLQQGKSPENEIACFVEQNPNCIIISDEIGNGIVPIDAFEREYRERTGRILISLARQAEEVERVICGMGQRIK